MANEQLKEATKSLFAGYQNNSKTTVRDFIDYVFGLGTADPTFDSLVVTGTSDLEGDVTMGANADITGTLHVVDVVTFDANLNVGEALTVDGDSLLKGELVIQQTLDVQGDTTMEGNVSVLGDTVVAFNNSYQLEKIPAMTANPYLKIEGAHLVLSNNPGDGIGIILDADKMGFFGRSPNSQPAGSAVSLIVPDLTGVDTIDKTVLALYLADIADVLGQIRTGLGTSGGNLGIMTFS